MLRDYISNDEATYLRVSEGYEGYELDAVNWDNVCTETCWTHYSGIPMSRRKAFAAASEFAREIGRPDLANKIYVWEQVKPNTWSRVLSFLGM